MYTNFIKSVLEKSSIISKSNFGIAAKHITKEGDNNQVLTEADLKISTLIVNAIKAEYPGHNIIDEEAGAIDNNSDFTWVIDPIDGTSNFASGLPHYGIMIGLLQSGQPVTGGIALPEFNEIYLASRGEGTFCNGERIFVTSSNKLLDNLVAYNIDGNQKEPQVTHEEVKTVGEVILNIRNIRNSGSAYDLCMTAKGNYGACLTKTAKIWDIVAPQIILEEAGALVTDYYGSPLDYTSPIHKLDETFTWCIAPAALHKELQTIIHLNIH